LPTGFLVEAAALFGAALAGAAVAFAVAALGAKVAFGAAALGAADFATAALGAAVLPADTGAIWDAGLVAVALGFDAGVAIFAEGLEAEVCAHAEAAASTRTEIVFVVFITFTSYFAAGFAGAVEAGASWLKNVVATKLETTLSDGEYL